MACVDMCSVRTTINKFDKCFKSSAISPPLVHNAQKQQKKKKTQLETRTKMLYLKELVEILDCPHVGHNPLDDHEHLKAARYWCI